MADILALKYTTKLVDGDRVPVVTVVSAIEFVGAGVLRDDNGQEVAVGIGDLTALHYGDHTHFPPMVFEGAGYCLLTIV